MDSLRMGVNVPKIYFCVIKNGAYGIRTRDLHNAIVARSQLR